MSADPSAAWIWESELHFRDSRAPHDITALLERDLMILFRPDTTGPRLVLTGAMKSGGADYRFRLSFDAALFAVNCYTFGVAVFSAKPGAGTKDQFDKSQASWFGHWTRNFKASQPPDAGEGLSERYRAVVEKSLSAEAELVDVPAVQRAIIDAMRRGAYFSTAPRRAARRSSLPDRALLGRTTASRTPSKRIATRRRSSLFCESPTIGRRRGTFTPTRHPISTPRS